MFVVFSVKNAQSPSTTRRSRLSNKDAVGQTPQDMLRRSLRQKMREVRRSVNTDHTNPLFEVDFCVFSKEYNKKIITLHRKTNCHAETVQDCGSVNVF